MADQSIAGANQDLARLRRRLDGQVLLPEEPGYDQARQVWNAMVDRRPAVIVRCKGPADVAAAVGFARARDLEVGVRCGGHSVLGDLGAAGRAEREWLPRRLPAARCAAPILVLGRRGSFQRGQRLAVRRGVQRSPVTDQPPSLPHSLSSPMSAGRKTDTARISASASRGYA
jgi:hypothetical protein